MTRRAVAAVALGLLTLGSGLLAGCGGRDDALANSAAQAGDNADDQLAAQADNLDELADNLSDDEDRKEAATDAAGLNLADENAAAPADASRRP